MEVVQEKRLLFTDVIKAGVTLGAKNILPLILATILYIITIWIPYLNVGTTIGMYKLIIALGRDGKVDPCSIFNKENFKPVGNFFILMGIMAAGYLAAAIFMIIPAFILSIAWSMAIFIMIDKEVTPTKALSLSYSVTLGEKWKIFFIMFVLCLASSGVSALLALIPKVGAVLATIAEIFFAAFILGVDGVIYKKLSQKIIGA